MYIQIMFIRGDFSVPDSLVSSWVVMCYPPILSNIVKHVLLSVKPLLRVNVSWNIRTKTPAHLRGIALVWRRDLGHRYSSACTTDPYSTPHECTIPLQYSPCSVDACLPARGITTRRTVSCPHLRVPRPNSGARRIINGWIWGFGFVERGIFWRELKIGDGESVECVDEKNFFSLSSLSGLLRERTRNGGETGGS
ncbi:hypothetical protein L209DRAFT_236679 [Thermothelomyces heterothallicus CBS 203.75]